MRSIDASEAVDQHIGLFGTIGPVPTQPVAGHAEAARPATIGYGCPPGVLTGGGPPGVVLPWF
ncbi:MAG TPA: hypothetical protein VIR27_01870 [Mycobacteriales bacterium]